VRYELPPGLTPEEERAVEAALDEYFDSFRVRPSPWALAGRAEGCAIGALQIRHQSPKPWTEVRLLPYTRRGAANLKGRGDAK
jgi:hypothetical protein